MVLTLSWFGPRPPRQPAFKAVLQSEGGRLRKQHLKEKGEHNNYFVVYKPGVFVKTAEGDEWMLEVFLHQAFTPKMASSPIHPKDSA